MANAFTPGPWKVSFSKFSRVTAENGALIAKCEKLESLTNLEANARLIAMSPDLFSIANRLAALSEGLNNGSSAAEHEACKLAEEARVAVAKATGRRP
ncbi:hypothetical protein ACMFLR_18970 [Delftia tsuruhatensis]|uniref:hypothetical protein n=1 Tax=Delftia tsuruhatensis TaxID=180282 RepID=UPI002447DCCD|nr:hypothetical protein [Delftia tsuruhatensis]MDH0423516.1 hypothetical protein [Delftia tsuruhatensis]